jgi:putative ABC transport system ATP-binding protein
VASANISVSSSPTPDALLRASQLGRVVNGKVLVQDVNFILRSGEVLAIVGPSGSGKSSLLRLLNRLDEPTSGTVFLDGADYRQIVPRDLRRRVGMVTQRPYLFKGTIAENLQFGPKQRGETLSSESMDDLLSQVGLKGYASRTVANLSGGEAQRVSLARTLANSPSVLLLDEPTSALDDASKAEVEVLFQKVVRERHLGCVLVTHDSAQAARIAQQALALEHGVVVKAGTVSEVLRA